MAQVEITTYGIPKMPYGVISGGGIGQSRRSASGVDGLKSQIRRLSGGLRCQNVKLFLPEHLVKLVKDVPNLSPNLPRKTYNLMDVPKSPPKADCPSVIQVPTQDMTPDHLGRLVISALHQFEKHLQDGALVTIDQKRLRARILPMEA